MKSLIHFRLSLFFFFVLLLSIACKKSVDNPDTNPTPNPLDEKVTASVAGRVTDENNRPVSNASVKAGSSATTTDINGMFLLNNVQLSKNAGFVLIEKTGYFKTGRTFFPVASVVNNVVIKLIPKSLAGNFSSAAGGNINTGNNSSVSFPANGIIDRSTNSAYAGSVKVYSTYLSPEDPNLASIMPGNLTGLTTNNEQKLLQTYGMIAVELEGGAGEKLNLAAGKIATISMPIPASMVASAPATIPLWYFNDTTGVWIEQGTATKQGSNYLGTVSHFSFWNCDVPSNFVNLKMTLNNQSQQPLVAHKVVLKKLQDSSTATGYTDATGTVSGAVPNGVLLERKIYDRCNNLISTQNIGPFNASTDLGIVTVNSPGAVNLTITGTVTKCNSSPVTNGFADISLENVNYRAAVNNGSFSITIQRCSGTSTAMQISATDIDANQQSNVTSTNVTTGNVNAGTIVACGLSVAQYINYTIGANVINFNPAEDSMYAFRNSTTTNVNGFKRIFDSTTYRYTSFTFTGVAVPGAYTMNTSNFIVTKGFNLQYNIEGTMSVTISEYGNSGEFIAGTFSGNFREFYTNAVVTGTCNFRVKRFQ